MLDDFAASALRKLAPAAPLRQLPRADRYPLDREIEAALAGRVLGAQVVKEWIDFFIRYGTKKY